MPTIVFDGKDLSADTLEFDEDGVILSHGLLRIRRFGEYRVGFIGPQHLCELLFENITSESKYDSFSYKKLLAVCKQLKYTANQPCDCSAVKIITVDATNNAHCINPENGSSVWIQPPFAIGTGAKQALAALHLGVNTECAIGSAIRTDIFTGGLIYTLSDKSGAKLSRPPLPLHFRKNIDKYVDVSACFDMAKAEENLGNIAYLPPLPQTGESV